MTEDELLIEATVQMCATTLITACMLYADIRDPNDALMRAHTMVEGAFLAVLQAVENE